MTSATCQLASGRGPAPGRTDAFGACFRNGRSCAGLCVQSKPAFSRFPLVHKANFEGQQRVDLTRSPSPLRMTGIVQVFGRRRRQGCPRARTAGVQKAPGREVAGRWAAAGSRALWGFQVGGAFDGGETPGRCDPDACARQRARGWKKRPEGGVNGINGRRPHGLP